MNKEIEKTTACDEKIITYDKNGFIINGEHVFLIGGEFHYFRTPAALWDDRLQKVKNMGANLIAVYVPWNLHELREGEQRWDGDYDLDRFLTLCEKHGLYILIKPGPYICAELDFGGHPDWLIPKINSGEFRLRTQDDGYLSLCRYWYESCAKQINRHLITNGGNIIAAQIENEYDHLMQYGDEAITKDDAAAYFGYLKTIMEELGIDVPKFANEASFLRGREKVVDSRTYYPNIPGLWWWEYDLFEEKILSYKQEVTDSPVMILELQAGWFSQIGENSYCPGLELVEGVSKSVFITGASVINYYMLVGGTTFPFIGGRGDEKLGGFGNISSYDFGGAPVSESGEIHSEKYYWIKGFIRFAKEFSHIISDSDGINNVRIISGGEKIALLRQAGEEVDPSLGNAKVYDERYENFTTYEEGGALGRFFFVRNAGDIKDGADTQEEGKLLKILVPAQLTGTEYSFEAFIAVNETRLFPIDFTIPGTDLKLAYATSEVRLSKQYGSKTAFVLSGAKNAAGEAMLHVQADAVEVLDGDIAVSRYAGGALLKYEHRGIGIVKIRDVYLFIVEDGMSGRIEELPNGLMFHDIYYIQDISGDGETLSLQVKEGANNTICFFPFGRAPETICADGLMISFEKQPSGMLSASVSAGGFADKPLFCWISDWKYIADSQEATEDFDHSAWKRLTKTVSLEEAGFLEHGYIWYRSAFDLDDDPEIERVIDRPRIFFSDNNIDRYMVYINGRLAFRFFSWINRINKRDEGYDIAAFIKPGRNTIAVLYANEFHNKSHPHEGEIVKYSGIREPVRIQGKYKNGDPIDISIESFYVNHGLGGMSKDFMQRECDERNWKRISPSVEKFFVDKNLGHIVWFRRHFIYNPGEKFSAPLIFSIENADERLTVYVNGKPIARYDTIGPQKVFYIPDSYIDTSGDNVISIILECPGFYEELMGGFRRGYMNKPDIAQIYISKNVEIIMS